VKKIEWDNPNKMRIDSPFAVFNRQTNFIDVGNVIANTQYSSYIRPFTQTECNGFTWNPGYLRETDLRMFKELGVSERILSQVRTHTRDQEAILYVFFHYSRSARRRILDGVVLTSRDHIHVQTWYTNSDWRAQAAVEEARKYIAVTSQTVSKDEDFL
jgi:hypothetical protein